MIGPECYNCVPIFFEEINFNLQTVVTMTIAGGKHYSTIPFRRRHPTKVEIHAHRDTPKHINIFLTKQFLLIGCVLPHHSDHNNISL